MALEPATQVRIYNRALALLGSVERVDNVDDEQTVTDTLNALWPMAVREMQAEHPWNCCIARAVLSKVGAPVHGGGYLYQLPIDCLRWLPPAQDSCDWFRGTQEGNFIVADEGDALNIRYIALNEDVSTWPPHLVSLMAYRLAFDAAEAVTQSESVKESAREAYEGPDGEGGQLARAKRIDGLATGDRERGNVQVLSRTLSAGLFGQSYPTAPGR